MHSNALKPHGIQHQAGNLVLVGRRLASRQAQVLLAVASWASMGWGIHIYSKLEGCAAGGIRPSGSVSRRTPPPRLPLVPNPLPPAPAAIAAQALSAPHAMVRRDGRWQEVAVRELVPGDLVALKGGDVVPADCKVGGGAGGWLGRLVWVNGWVAIRCRGAQLDFRTKACGCLTQCIHLRRTPLPSSACQLLTLPPWAGPCCDSAAGGAG